MSALLGALGRAAAGLARYLGALGFLAADAARWAVVPPVRGRGGARRAYAAQMVRVGVRGMPIVFLVLFFIGVVLVLQLAYILEKFGALEYVATVVGVAMTRELGPLLTAIVMSGFAGASIAAELGTMVVNEEVLALETSGIHPVRFLVLPRVVACMVMVLCLTVLGNLVGMAGGYLVGTGLLGINPALYWGRTIEMLQNKDMITGLVKAEVFAITLAVIACVQGLRVRGGAEGVGRATTNAVVHSIIAIIALDCALTAVFYYVLD
jgi:phospholipid/cholesterol/gamma-HCH transport system permease protein